MGEEVRHTPVRKRVTVGVIATPQEVERVSFDVDRNAARQSTNSKRNYDLDLQGQNNWDDNLTSGGPYQPRLSLSAHLNSTRTRSLGSARGSRRGTCIDSDSEVEWEPDDYHRNSLDSEA